MKKSQIHGCFKMMFIVFIMGSISFNLCAQKSSKLSSKIELVTVPAAEFDMPEGWRDLSWENTYSKLKYETSMENPIIVVEFLMAKTETTYEQWYEVVKWAIDESRGENRYRFIQSGREGSGRGGKIDKIDGKEPTNCKREPVTCISIYDAIVWCNALSEKQGLEPVYYLDGTVVRNARNLYELKKSVNVKGANRLAIAQGTIPYLIRFLTDYTKSGYRLPTRAEWYLAAKGCKPGSYEWDYKYSGSDTATEVAWFSRECGYQDNIGKMNEYLDEYGTKPVGGKKANALGLYDMSGNVCEFLNDIVLEVVTHDWLWEFNSDIYCCFLYTGGCWLNSPNNYSELNLTEKGPDDTVWKNGGDGIGFRVVRNAK